MASEKVTGLCRRDLRDGTPTAQRIRLGRRTHGSDTAAHYTIPHVGVSQVLWGSDFPHFRSIGLEAQSALHELVGSLPREAQEKVVGGNAATVFNVE